MFRFTIRDLLWPTLLAAVLVAWWVDRGGLARQLDRMEQWHNHIFADDEIFGLR